ncbi:MAG: M1 family metallopeptidase [Bacteroidota bacterium]
MNAVNNGTRTLSGEPGPRYWTNYTSYSIQAELSPEDTVLLATASIQFTNNSPLNTPVLFLELAQNLHAEGAVRKEEVEVTGGVSIHQVTLQGEEIQELEQLGLGVTGWGTQGTLLAVLPGKNIVPNSTLDVEITYSFKIPRAGASERMGYNDGNLYHMAYWYPQVVVMDDLEGWFTDPFTGNAEFYAGFGDYELFITVPEQWIVMGTGDLINAEQVLAPRIFKRYEQAAGSDEVVSIVTPADYGASTIDASNDKLTWRFSSRNVRDVAFSVVRESNWDGMRTPVGDLNNDGVLDYTRIHAFWRSKAPEWRQGAEFGAHSIKALSEYTAFPYPWPHMTLVEGDGIISGGMEFPMTTLIGGDRYKSNPTALYDVIAHELAHMWMPMIVSNNERRRAWMDEGSTTFHEAQSRWDHRPESYNLTNEFAGYLQVAGTPFEGEIMRYSDYHYPGPAYGVASYPKPATVLFALQGVIGEEVFHEAWKTYIQNWAYKHPTPYDLFHTFETVSGKDLDWFWRSWYYETWALDQALDDVTQADGTTTITIKDLGNVPMPVILTVFFADGGEENHRLEVTDWLRGKRTASLVLDTSREVVSVEIDRLGQFPDKNRGNNTWQK